MKSISSVKQSIKQAIALSKANIRSIPKRSVASAINVFSIACVTAVMLSVLAMIDGMVKTMARTGLDNTLLVMRSGAISELQSVLFPAEVKLLANHQQILRDKNDSSVISAEMFVNAKYTGLKKASDSIVLNENKISQDKNLVNRGESLALRGIGGNTFYFRPNLQLVAGKHFSAGLRELLVGRAIARRFPEMAIGKTILLGNSQWIIRGIFSDNNSVFESELWADIGIVQSDYQRSNTVQSVRIALHENTNAKALNQEWNIDPRLNVRVILEKEFFAEQGKNLTRLIRWIGLPVALIMAIGAIIAALNTMFSATTSRRKEIATHKAIGFSSFGISAAIISEAIILSFAGGLVGVLSIYLIFDNWAVATTNSNNLSQMMFNFEITSSLMTKAMLLSISIGLLGGILPAIQAIRLPLTVALRDN